MLNNAGKSDFLHILVDTNGVKKPNVFGKDVFTFVLALNDKNRWKVGDVATQPEEQLSNVVKMIPLSVQVC